MQLVSRIVPERLRRGMGIQALGTQSIVTLAIDGDEASQDRTEKTCYCSSYTQASVKCVTWPAPLPPPPELSILSLS